MEAAVYVGANVCLLIVGRCWSVFVVWLAKRQERQKNSICGYAGQWVLNKKGGGIHT